MATDWTATLTTERVQELSQQGLETLADAVSFYIDSLAMVPDSGLYGDAEVSLHVVALEMNRRHGAASVQADDPAAALQILEEIEFTIDAGAGEDLEWERVRISQARAYGVLLDKGTGQSWFAADIEGYTRSGVIGGLQRLAVKEGLRRGFDHWGCRPVQFVPVDTTGQPF